MSLRRVYGASFDGTNITITIGKKEIPCLKISYGDGLETAFLSYMGSQQQDEQTQGTYKTDEVKITMSEMVFRTVFMPAMPQNGGGNVPLNIVVGRHHSDVGNDSDLLEKCRWTKPSSSPENSNKPQEIEMTFTVKQIFWTNERKTINQLRTAGQVPIGAVTTGF